jgi:pimeloyl-ACP methyl ester carboxylesterase
MTTGPNAPADIDPGRHAVRRSFAPGFGMAYVRETGGPVPLVLLHGWPESKRIYWRVIAPLAAAGFDVVVPDLRGFGDSDVAPDGRNDVPSHVDDLVALLDDLGIGRAVIAAADLGGAVAYELAHAHPERVERLVIANAPLPWLPELMGGLTDTRPTRGSSDYVRRQGFDADGLAAELATPDARRWYVATFYQSRFWAHPGQFDDPEVLAFHTEPFADAARLRAGFGNYESMVDPARRSRPRPVGQVAGIETLILFGTSDHVMYPAFDRMAAVVYPDHVGPFLLRDCGHFVPWEAPHAFISGIRSFCRDLLAV